MRGRIPGIALSAIVIAAIAIPVAQAQPPSSTAWLIFIDDLHADFRSTPSLRSLVDTIVTTLVADGNCSALVSSRPSSNAHNLSLDREGLRKLTRTVSGAALSTHEIVRILRGELQSNELRARAVLSLSAAEDGLSTFEQHPTATRAVVYISKGYGVEPLPDSSQAPPGAVDRATKPLSQVTADDVRQHLAGLMASARRLGATIFTVDARRLRVAPDDPIENTPEALRYRDNTRASLRAIAEGTGGFAILEEDVLDAGLANINRAMRR